MSADVAVDVDAGVAVLTLNRPENLNAYTAEMGKLLSRAYLECDGDDSQDRQEFPDDYPLDAGRRARRGGRLTSAVAATRFNVHRTATRWPPVPMTSAR